MTRTVWAITSASFKMFTRDKQVLYFSLVLPVVIILLFGLVLGDYKLASGMRYRDFFIPGLMALTTLQLGVFSVAFIIARYKERGILKKLTTTPLRPADYLGGEILARLTISVLQIFLLLATAILALSFTMRGSYLNFAIISLLGSLVFLALGFMIAGIAKTVETVPAIANMIIFPMLFFGDVFFPIESLPDWLEPVAKLLPIQFLADSLRLVILEGAGLADLSRNILGMLVWLVIFFFLAQKTFRLGAKN